MAYIIKPPEGQTTTEGWKNTPYAFYVPTASVDAVTGLPITVAVPMGTYTWSELKGQKVQLQAQIDELNIKMNTIEAAQV